MPPYEIQVCRPELASSIARAKMSAFYETANWRALWADTPLEEIIAGAADREPWNLTRDRADRRHIMAVDTETGQAVGYARWIVPKGMESMWLEAQVQDPSSQDKTKYKQSFDKADWHIKVPQPGMDDPFVDIGAKYTKGKTLLILDYLAVHPAHKRRGIATMLARSGVEQADAAGIGAYIMAFPTGMTVYKKLGFELKESLTQDDSMYGGDGNYTMHFMLREPRALSQEPSAAAA